MLKSILVATLVTHVAYAERSNLSRKERVKLQAIYWNAGDEPPSMDPTKQADSVSGFWLGHLYEGLMRTDKYGKLTGGVAAKTEHTSDYKTWTFHLRTDAKWHDGKVVTAADFVYAWQRLVDPEYASEYSFIAISAGLLNAQNIIEKKMPKSALGVTALNSQTLKVTLERPIPYFDSITAFQVFYPVRQDFVDKYSNNFALSQESIMGNGPFMLRSWRRDESLTIVKSPYYWAKDEIKATLISSPQMVKDSQANFNNFLTGGIDFTGASSPELIKQAQAANFKIQTFPSGCVSYLDLNVRPGRAFHEKAYRKALQAGINQREYINKILGTPGNKPAWGLVPDYLPGSSEGKTYREEVGLFLQPKGSPLIQHTPNLQPITILAGDSGRAKKIAEYWQNRLSKILPHEIRVSSVPFKTRLQKTRDGDFDLSLSGWCPDYNDPMTFMDLFTSFNDNNHTGWKNSDYDRLILSAQQASSKEERVKLFFQAETLLYEEAPIIPIEQSGGGYLLAPGLKGVRRQVLGADPDFRFSYWEEKK